MICTKEEIKQQKHLKYCMTNRKKPLKIKINIKYVYQ